MQSTELKNWFNGEKKEYTEFVSKQMNKRNRRNIQNIINFIREEREYWNKLLSGKFEDED
jgi:uncharacterized protein YeaO (DUF488 family)